MAGSRPRPAGRQSNRQIGRPTGGQGRGLTLIELVAAMALFALLAVMGLQALTATLRMRERLTTLERQAGELSLGLALLRNDLSAMVPLLFHPPGGGRSSALMLSPDGLVLGFSISGQADLAAPDGLGLHRVEWRLDPARQLLLRRVWPLLTPASEQVAHPEVGYFSGVTELSLRSNWPQLGWLSGVSSGVVRSAAAPGAGDGDGGLRVLVSNYSDTLPEAVELSLQIEGIGRVSLLETLR